MTCPNCGRDWLKPYDVKQHDDGTIRYYRCGQCNLYFETVEQVRAVSGVQAFQATMFNVLKQP